MNQPSSDSMVSRFRARWDEYRQRVTWWTLIVVLVAFVVGSIVEPFGDFLTGLRFGGSALMVAVALLLLDAIGSDRSAVGDDAGLVVERSSQLNPYFMEALRKRDFSVVFSGYSGETLYRILSDCFNEIERGRGRTETLSIRLLLPDCDQPMVLPCRTDDLEDFPPYRELASRRTEEYVRKIEAAVSGLESSGKVRRVSFEVRYHRLPPVFKAYVINDELCFWGLYPIEESTFRAKAGEGGNVDVYDAKGTRAAMFGIRAGAGKTQELTYKNVVMWIETVWETIARASASGTRTGGQ